MPNIDIVNTNLQLNVDNFNVCTFGLSLTSRCTKVKYHSCKLFFNVKEFFTKLAINNETIQRKQLYGTITDKNCLAEVTDVIDFAFIEKVFVHVSSVI